MYVRICVKCIGFEFFVAECEVLVLGNQREKEMSALCLHLLRMLVVVEFMRLFVCLFIFF